MHIKGDAALLTAEFLLGLGYSSRLRSGKASYRVLYGFSLGGFSNNFTETEENVKLNYSHVCN
jgi:hypothetical protein